MGMNQKARRCAARAIIEARSAAYRRQQRYAERHGVVVPVSALHVLNEAQLIAHRAADYADVFGDLDSRRQWSGAVDLLGSRMLRILVAQGRTR